MTYLFILFDLLSFCWLTHTKKTRRDTWSLEGLWEALFSINVCYVKTTFELFIYLCCVRESHFISTSSYMALFSHYFSSDFWHLRVGVAAEIVALVTWWLKNCWESHMDDGDTQVLSSFLAREWRQETMTVRFPFV